MNENIKIIEMIIKRQYQLNDKTFPNWRTELTENDWDTAIFVESAEAIDSFNWKWWKKGEDDINNLKVELVDILHFLISYGFYFDVKPEEYVIAFNSALKYDKNQKINKEAVVKHLKRLNFENYPSDKFLLLSRCLLFIGIDSIEKLFKEYMVKNVLNEFRQNKGYKSGEYIKMWKLTEPFGDLYWETEVEDNVVAYSIANNLKIDEEFVDNLYTSLENVYKKIIKK